MPIQQNSSSKVVDRNKSYFDAFTLPIKVDNRFSQLAALVWLIERKLILVVK